MEELHDQTKGNRKGDDSSGLLTTYCEPTYSHIICPVFRVSLMTSGKSQYDGPCSTGEVTGSEATQVVKTLS